MVDLIAQKNISTLYASTTTYASTTVSTVTFQCFSISDTENFYMWTFEGDACGCFMTCHHDYCPTPQVLSPDRDWKFKWLVKDDKRMIGTIATFRPRDSLNKNTISSLDESDFEAHGWTLILTFKADCPRYLESKF